MKVLLTGATGRVGSHTCQALLDAGFDVRATDRGIHRKLSVRVEMADVLDRMDCYRLCEGMDAVIHLANHPTAWHGDAQKVYTENVTMNFNVFQAAAEMGVKKVVFASSIQTINGDRHYRPGDELPPSNLAYLPIDGDLPANAANPYSLSKITGEQQLQYFSRWKGMSCTAIRLPGTIEPDWFERIREHRMKDRESRRPMLLDEAFALLRADDAGELFAAVLKADLPGYRVYLPACPTPAIDRPIPDIIAEFFPNVPLKKPLAEMHSLVDITRITRDTGWAPKHDLAV